MKKIVKLRRFTIPLILLLMIFNWSLQAGDCMIDQCKDCDFKNVYTCNACNGGYYLVSFFGTEKSKTYHSCWKTFYLILGILSLLICPCLYALCAYLLYKNSQKIIWGKPAAPAVEIIKKQQTPDNPQNQVNIQPSQMTTPQNIDLYVGNNVANPPQTNINVGNSVSQAPQIRAAVPVNKINQPNTLMSQNQNRCQGNQPIQINPISNNQPMYANRVPASNQMLDNSYKGNLGRRVVATNRLPKGNIDVKRQRGINIIEKDHTLVIERSPAKQKQNLVTNSFNYQSLQRR